MLHTGNTVMSKTEQDPQRPKNYNVVWEKALNECFHKHRKFQFSTIQDMKRELGEYIIRAAVLKQ